MHHHENHTLGERVSNFFQASKIRKSKYYAGFWDLQTTSDLRSQLFHFQYLLQLLRTEGSEDEGSDME